MADGSDAAESTLSCARCGKPAHLQCPKCMELKLDGEGAAFCTQDCFKASWSSHKSVHLKAKLSTLGSGAPGEQNSASTNEDWLYCLKKGQARTPKLPHFDWTGVLWKALKTFLDVRTLAKIQAVFNTEEPDNNGENGDVNSEEALVRSMGKCGTPWTDQSWKP